MPVTGVIAIPSLLVLQLHPTISHKIQDDNGGCVVIIESINIPYALCNVYAPSGGTHKSVRKEFFPRLEQTLKDLNLTNYIIGGDFNCILDDSLDRNIPPAANSEGVKLLLFISSVNCNGNILILVITPSL